MITSLKSTAAKFGALLALSLFTSTNAMAATAGGHNLQANDLVSCNLYNFG